MTNMAMNATVMILSSVILPTVISAISVGNVNNIPPSMQANITHTVINPAFIITAL
jgi:hypothetical protein